MKSEREFRFAILRFLSERGRKFKWNALRPVSLGGELEPYLGVGFDAMDRTRASRAWDSLQRADLIFSDGQNPTDPENWVEISPSGRRALERHALDDLDDVLLTISPRIVELRDEAWAALEGGGDEAFGQAASTMCEVVDKTLRALAEGADVREASWFERRSEATPVATRAERARLIMERRHGRHEEDICRALVAAHKVLTALKHASKPYSREEGRRALFRAEDALRQVLLWPTSGERAE